MWPSKVRLLLLHWRSLPAAARSLWTQVFPSSLLAELALPEEADYTMGGVLGLINLYTVYSLRIQGGTECRLSPPHLPADMVEGKIQTDADTVLANISLTPAQVQSVGGEQ